MAIYRDQLKEMVYEQKKILMKYTNERNKCKEGNLAYCANHGKKTYYHTHYEDGRYVRTSIDRNPEVIKELARKEFLSVSCKVLNHNIKVLEKAEKRLLDGDIDYLKGNMQKAYRQLPDEYFFSGMSKS